MYCVYGKYFIGFLSGFEELFEKAYSVAVGGFVGSGADQLGEVGDQSFLELFGEVFDKLDIGKLFAVF
jgi:hypothetical protein